MVGESGSHGGLDSGRAGLHRLPQHVARRSCLRQDRGLGQRWPPLRAVPATRSYPGLQGVVRDRRSPSRALRERSAHSPASVPAQVVGDAGLSYCPGPLGRPETLSGCSAPTRTPCLTRVWGQASFALRHSTNRLPPPPRCGGPAWGQACPLVGTLNLEPQGQRQAALSSTEGTIPDAHLDAESRPTENKPVPRSSPIFAHAITHAHTHAHVCADSHAHVRPCIAAACTHAHTHVHPCAHEHTHARPRLHCRHTRVHTRPYTQASHGTARTGPDQIRSWEPSPWTPARPTPLQHPSASQQPIHTLTTRTCRPAPGHLHPFPTPTKPHTQLVLMPPPTPSLAHSPTRTGPSLGSADPPTLRTWPPGEEDMCRSGRLPPGGSQHRAGQRQRGAPADQTQAGEPGVLRLAPELAEGCDCPPGNHPWAGTALTTPFLSRAAPGRQLCRGPGRGAGRAVDHHLNLHHPLPAQRVLQRHRDPL